LGFVIFGQGKKALVAKKSGLLPTFGEKKWAEKTAENGQKRAKTGIFWAFLGCFGAVLKKKRHFCPFAHFFPYIYKNL
jgi:hypothetical protein